MDIVGSGGPTVPGVGRWGVERRRMPAAAGPSEPVGPAAAPGKPAAVVDSAPVDLATIEWPWSKDF